MRRLIVVLLLLALSGCHYQHVTHDPNRAVRDTNNFLKALYIDQNYQRALDLGDNALHKATTVQDLEQLVKTAEANAGKLEELRAESYLQTLGKTMEVFYTAKYHNATLFQCLVLTGDASEGYKVSGVWLKDSPYPEQALRRQFHTKIVVQ